MRSSVKALPAGYRLDGKFDLVERKGLALWLNILGGVSIFAYAVIFGSLARALRPADAASMTQVEVSGAQAWGLLIRLVVLTVGMLLLHEAVHGLAFRLFNGEWGTFAFKLLYAYAAAPDWYLPRNQYLVTALAPYLGLSLLGVALMLVLPGAALPDLLYFLILNAAGATGDLVIVAWMLRKPPDVLVNDYGDGLAVYAPGEAGA